MILQLLQREHLLGVNCSVVVIHMDKTRIVFDSFKQFNEYATGTSSPTHKVVLVYKYAIEYSGNKEIAKYWIKRPPIPVRTIPVIPIRTITACLFPLVFCIL